MEVGKRNPKVSDFINKSEKWQGEMECVRTIFLKLGLHEDFKWNKPSYSIEGHNLIGIMPLKNHLTILFHKGVLINDELGILIKPGEESQSARQIRFTNLEDILKMEEVLIKYVLVAIDNEKNGIEVELTRSKEVVLCSELEYKLRTDSLFKEGFDSLTKGRQRQYNIFIKGAKQKETREKRILKYYDKILLGKGMND